MTTPDPGDRRPSAPHVPRARTRDDETPLKHDTVPARRGAGPRPVVSAGPSVREGSRLGDYRIVRPIGSGGMASVFLARDEALDRDVAIKIAREVGSGSLETIERFRSEARAMARIAHPNVVRIHALGDLEGVPYIVMEHVPGEDLSRLLAQRGGRLRLAEALAVLDQICRGASAIHAAGLVHGDLKPANVLFGPGFRVVLSDFGLSRRTTAPPSTWSTPAYGAPELARGDELAPELAQRVDVYSIAVMAYELFTGRLPFDPEERRLHAIDGLVPPRPSALRSELPPELDVPILAALTTDPELRTPSADALRRALEHVPLHPAPDHRLRILVADDDPDYRDLVRRTLARSFRGSTIESVGDGTAALASARAMRPDLVVTDLDMPGLNGVELLAEMRSDPSLESVPVVVLSAIGGPADWALLGRLGAQAFVGKPFDAQQLTSVAHAITG